MWTCLVEVKTAGAALRPEQVNAYLDIARENGFDGVLTISNQITAASSESPISVDGRKLKRTALWHFSWWRVLTEAIVQQRYRGISDPDQAWILGELIAYLDSAASRAGGFEDMGDRWVAVRKAAHDGTLRQNDPEARSVAERWEEFTQYLCLGLSQDLGRSVSSPRARGQTTAARLDESVKQLAADGSLVAVLHVPDAIGDIRIRADLRARRTLTGVAIEAPREGRAKPRINWLLRQLADAPADLRVEAAFPNARQTTSVLLADAREEPDKLLYPADPKREPRAFTITLARAMGHKRGKAEGSFVRETRAQTFDFYREIVQQLKPWQARPPKLRGPDAKEEVPEQPSPEPPRFEESGVREIGEAADPLASAGTEETGPDVARRCDRRGAPRCCSCLAAAAWPRPGPLLAALPLIVQRGSEQRIAAGAADCPFRREGAVYTCAPACRPERASSAPARRRLVSSACGALARRRDRLVAWL